MNIGICILRQVLALYSRAYKLLPEKCFQCFWENITAGLMGAFHPYRSNFLINMLNSMRNAVRILSS